MTLKTRTETANVEYDECNNCNAVIRTAATVGVDEEKFDPRSRSQGWQTPYLWKAHPWHLTSLCSRCIDYNVHIVESLVRLPGMVRVKVFDVERCEKCDGKGCSLRSMRKTFCQAGWIYNTHGLRLRPDPPNNKELNTWTHGLVIIGEQAIATTKQWGHWMPTRPEWIRDLADGDRKVILCEPSEATPYPTVIEPLWNKDTPVVAPDSSLWGIELCMRADSVEAEGYVDFLRLRVPAEILQ